MSISDWMSDVGSSDLLWTGYMGALDENGFLTLKDRSKDVIMSGGTNIYPREVEEALLTHEAVAEVSVIGEPDPDWGENVLAIVVLKTDAQADAAALDGHCQQQIARFKQIGRASCRDRVCQYV